RIVANVGGRIVANVRFVLPELNDKAKQFTDQMLAEVRGILGEERWPILQARLKERRGGVITSSDLNSTLNQSKQDLTLWVETDDKRTPTMGLALQGAVATM